MAIFRSYFKFKYPDYFYVANPNISYYIGINVVSMCADFSYFTYHTLIFFCIWCILLGISSLLGFKKMNNICKHKGVVVFVFTNYLITTVLYTIFEFANGNPTFGLYDNSNHAIHNFGTNILAHYVFFLLNLFIFIKIKPVNEIIKHHYLIMVSYVIVYYIYVKITGMYMYDIEWYPYPIFDTKSLFGLLNLEMQINPIMEYLILIIFVSIMAFLYNILLKLLNKIK